MSELSTTYMGLPLTTPIVAGASRMTGSLDGIRECVRAGAGAVVLKSIFEEQIQAQVAMELSQAEAGYYHAEAADYVSQYSRENAVGEYLELIRQAKQKVSVPVIASVHCVSAGAWTEFAERAVEAGADGLELNVFALPSDLGRDAAAYEQLYFDLATQVSARVSVPVSLKVSPHFTALARTLGQLSQTGIAGLVLFNRFLQPDIDIEGKRIVHARYTSQPGEITLPLRWIGLLARDAGCDLCASTGVHDGAAVVKQLLAGAAAVQVASALYLHGTKQLSSMLAELRAWMTRHGHTSIDEFRGSVSLAGDASALERVQFMKSVSGME